MTNEQRLRYLEAPSGNVDVVLDTDAYNEIDDQYAIAYLLRSKEKINVRAICAAPFFKSGVSSAQEGMEKSYDEIQKILSLTGESVPTFKGAGEYLKDESTPVISDASRKIAELANEYSPANPLYVVAIGAITNVASALLLNPEMKERTVVVWLGGNAHHHPGTAEFNMVQDIAAARVVMQSGVPFVQLPCAGVVDRFSISRPELEYWFLGKNELSDYLAKITIAEAEKRKAGKPWTRVIWDVTAIAWLINGPGLFMKSKIIPTRVPTYKSVYDTQYQGYPMAYVYHIYRDALMTDLIDKLTK